MMEPSRNILANEIGAVILDNKAMLQAMKTAAVNNQQYELAADLRAEELKLFPEINKESDPYLRALKQHRYLKMLDFKIPPATCFLFEEFFLAFKEAEGDFGDNEFDRIITEQKAIFG